MKVRALVILIVDLVVLTTSFLAMVAYKPGSANYLSTKYLIGFGILLVSWILASIYFKKFRFKKKHSLQLLLNRIFISNLAALSIVAVFIIAFEIAGYSRLVFFGTVGIATLVEVFIGNLYFLLIHTVNGKTDLINPPPNVNDIRKFEQSINYRDISVDTEALSGAIIQECGEKAFEFINNRIDLKDPKLLTISTTTRFNIEYQPNNYFKSIVNLKRVNDIQFINKFFETINRKLPKDGSYIGCVETKDQRKRRILKKFPPGLNYIMYFFDFIVKRIFPKFLLTKKIYFLLTRGNNRVITRAEVMGRLYSCGFEIEDEADIDNHFFFMARKKEEPAYDMNPTYGPFVKLRRVGKNGKMIRVYKLRTMHPYAEYLQPYIYKKHSLDKGGKFKEDFRISTMGRILRTFWIDELPMLFNFLKGDLKIVGVRPLSKHYFELYDQELQDLRIKTKPGLIPPFYADMPTSLEEIQASEKEYLNAYFKRPLRTDFRYFWKAVYNIIFKKARSK